MDEEHQQAADASVAETVARILDDSTRLADFAKETANITREELEVELAQVVHHEKSTDTPEGRKRKNAKQVMWDMAGDWRDMQPDKDQFVIDGVVPVGEVTLLVGSGGGGKSTLAAMTCFEVAANAPASGHGGDTLPWFWKINENFRGAGASFVSFEDKPATLRARIDPWLAYRWTGSKYKPPSELEPGGFTIFNERGAGHGPLFGKGEDGGEALWLPRGIARLMAIERLTVKPKLVVIDPTAACYAGSEIDRSQVRAFTRPLAAWADQNDIAVILITHPPKDRRAGEEGVGSVSGSTDWVNGVRSVIEIGSVSVKWRFDSQADEYTPSIPTNCSGYLAYNAASDDTKKKVVDAIEGGSRVSSIAVLKANQSAPIAPALMRWMRHDNYGHCLWEFDKSCMAASSVGGWKPVVPRKPPVDGESVSHPPAARMGYNRGVNIDAAMDADFDLGGDD